MENDANDAEKIKRAQSRQIDELPTSDRKVQRLTLAEAADEIKRLRREVREKKKECLEANETIEKAKASLHEKDVENKELENKLHDITRNLELLRASQQKEKVEVESLSEDLKKKAQIATDVLAQIRASSIPIKEARKLTYKALRKGRALQYIGFLYTNNSICNQLMREAFNEIATNAFGSVHVAYRSKYGTAPGAPAYSESHIRLFRQEQLILLSENERLSKELKELHEIVTNKKHSDTRNALESAIWNDMNDIGFEKGIPKAPSRLKGVSGKNTAAQNNGVDADDAQLKFFLLSHVLSTARIRLLSHGFRRITMFSLYMTDKLVYETKEQSALLSGARECLRSGVSLIDNIMRSIHKRMLFLGIVALIRHAKTKAITEQLKIAARISSDRTRGIRKADDVQQCRACMAWAAINRGK